MAIDRPTSTIQIQLRHDIREAHVLPACIPRRL
jgi:hypothetical protein